MKLKNNTICSYILAIATIFYLTLGIGNTALAAEETILLSVESILDGATLTGNYDVTGWALGKAGISKVEVFVDGKLNGQAIYGASRQDISSQYPSYANSINNGFTYSLNTKKLINGTHAMNVTAYAVDGSSTSKQLTIKTNNQQTPIIGQAKTTKSQMIKYFLNNNNIKGYDYINNFTSIVMEEASAEGIRADVVFAQIMKETNFLKFTGTVKEEQNNFAGLGATGPGIAGYSFPDIRTGIRAVVQHLKAYASVSPLTKDCVDPRYSYVRKGSAPIVEWLGIQENPNGTGWATDGNYGYDIVNRVNSIVKLTAAEQPAKITSFTVPAAFYANKSYVISGTGTSENKVQYQFWILDYSVGSWKLAKDYNDNGSFTWTPAKTGRYRIELHVKDVNSNKDFDDNIFKDIEVMDGNVARNAVLSMDKNIIQGKNYVLTGSGESGNKLQYQFWIKDYNTGNWSLLQDYSDNNTYNWSVSKLGKYRIELHIKDIKSTKEFDSNSFIDIEVKQPNPAKIIAFNIDLQLFLNRSYTITSNATADNAVLYQYWILDYSTGAWSLVRDYSQNQNFIWKPTKIGNYRIELHVKDSYSNRYFDSNIFEDVNVSDQNQASNASFTIDSNLTAGKTCTITGSGASGNKLLYQYWIMDYTVKSWQVVQDYSENNTLNWKPAKGGNYRVELHIKDSNSSRYFDSNFFKDVVVTGPSPAKIISFNLGSEFYTTRSYNITTTGTSDNKILYQYWILDYNTGNWSLLRDYSEDGNYTWIPSKSGRYRIEVHAKDQYSDKYFDMNSFNDVQVYEANTARNAAISLGSTFTIGGQYNITASGQSENKVLYEFWVLDYSKNSWSLVQNYSENNVFKWTPDNGGRYRIEVHIKNVNSKNYFDSNAFKDVEVKALQPAKVSALNMSPELYMNRNYTITATGSSENKVLYEFWVLDYSTGQWKLVRDYSEDSTYTWTPSKTGKYRIEIHVKDIFSKNYFDSNTFQDVMAYDPSVARNAAITIPSDFKAGLSYNISGSGVSGNKVLYQFWVMDYSKGTWDLVQEYSDNSIFIWKTTKAGTYRVELHIKDSNSSNYFDSNTFIDVKVKGNGLVGRTIVLDAGHNYGGDDGAYRTFGGVTYSERDLNMQMALKVKAELERLGANVILTRDENDRSTDSANSSLQKRVDIANKANADLFISLHHDVSSNSATTGISTHYSTYKPGIDNSGVVNGDDPNGWYWGKDGVKIDTTPSDAAVRSRDLAIKLASGLSSSLGYNNLNAHDHNLFVTVNTNMPAVLIEEGFLSNQAEAQRCADQTQQTIKAQKIAQIIDEYFKTN